MQFEILKASEHTDKTDLADQEVAAAIARDFEQHWSLPQDSLSQGAITHIFMESRHAVWTKEGGVVACSDLQLASGIAGEISRCVEGSIETLLPVLQNVVAQSNPLVTCAINCYLYCLSPIVYDPNYSSLIEILRPEEVWPDMEPGGPEFEHVFAIRDGGKIISHAENIPQAEFCGRRYHAIGVGTHPDHRGKGYAKALVSSLVQHIALEGGISGWSCDATNAASLAIARSVGFIDHLWEFSWEPGVRVSLRDSAGATTSPPPGTVIVMVPGAGFRFELPGCSIEKYGIKTGQGIKAIAPDGRMIILPPDSIQLSPDDPVGQFSIETPGCIVIRTPDGTTIIFPPGSALD